jgi:hypothetical protein
VLGVADGELIMLLPAASAGAQPQPSRANAGAQRDAAALELAEDGSARTPVAFIQAVKGRPELMAQLHSSNPALASAVHKEDVEALQVRGHGCSCSCSWWWRQRWRRCCCARCCREQRCMSVQGSRQAHAHARGGTGRPR